MITRHKIAPNCPEFSRLVYGTWRILDEEDKTSCTPQALLSRFKACADLGITTIDTAEIYGVYKVEEAIGGALKLDPAFRSKIEIVTKCGMGIDEIDLLLVHRPDWLTSADETAEGLNKLLKDGKIRSAGVSNYNVHQFELLNSRMDQPLVTNQIEFSLLHMDPIYDGTADQCQRHRILPMAWSPLAKGALMDTQDPAAVRLHAKAAELAAKYNGATLDQLAYAWIMAHPSCPLPIIGTNKLQRIQAVVKAADIKLDREDWYGLWEAAKGQGVP
ncbi:MAG: hypothetical protein B7Z37_07490 [Verrucomicrobia bacterium 12-59-8]|nr:MAG: hypothetical protein B7Z37_07490 [Verrucomicrobia bacterium 12-59-8]